MQKFVVQPSASSRHELVNAHFRHCRAEQVPYVVVEARRLYATVRWDFIAFDRWVDPIISAAGRSFVDGLIEVFRRHAGPKSHYDVCAHVAEFRQVPVEQAEALAAALFDYVASRLTRGHLV